MGLVKWAVATLAGLYALVTLVAWGAQRHLVYAPDPTYVVPASLGLTGVEEHRIEAPDGVSLIAWHAPAKSKQPTLLYFHGNAANLAARAERIRRFTAEGVGIFILSYRGYSGSGGVPSEVDNVADAKLAYAELRRIGVAADAIVLYGESLGTGVASQVALSLPAAGLILDAPYTSVVDVGAERYPFLPVRWLLTHRYETLRVIPNVRMPLLVVHGELDRIVPVEMGRKVFAAAIAAVPKRLVVLAGAGHGNHYRFGSFEAIMEFARKVTAN